MWIIIILLILLFIFIYGIDHFATKWSTSPIGTWYDNQNRPVVVKNDSITFMVGSRSGPVPVSYPITMRGDTVYYDDLIGKVEVNSRRAPLVFYAPDGVRAVLVYNRTPSVRLN